MKQFVVNYRSWTGERNLCCVAKTLKLDEISRNIDLNDPYNLMKHVLCSNGSWIDANSSVPKWKLDL